MIQTQMQKRTLRVLEFTKIREQLADLAVTEMGREICLALEPETNLEEVRAAQQETEESTVVIQYLGSSPLSAFADVRSSLSLAEKGATLSPKALLEVATMLRVSRNVRDALVTDRETTPELPRMGSGLSDGRRIELDITDAILSHDVAVDAAQRALDDYGIRTMVLPPVAMGAQNPGQRDLKFCIHYRQDTQCAILADTVASLHHQGFRKLLRYDGGAYE